MSITSSQHRGRLFSHWFRFILVWIGCVAGLVGTGLCQTFTVLPPLDSGTYSDEDGDLAGYGTYALAVSGDGSVIAGYAEKSNGSSTAFLWKDDAYTEIPFAYWGLGHELFISADGKRVFGRSPNGNLQIREEDGQIVPGSYGPWISFNHEFEGQRSPVGGWNSRWDTRSGNIQLSLVYAISEDFSTAVGERFNETTKRYEAVIWKGESAIVLSPTDGAAGGVVTGVSADGSVACGYFRYETDFRTAGFVWTEDDGVVLISELITNSGLQWHPALPLRPRAVSADGTTVIGDVEGYIQGFAEGLASEGDPYQDMAWHLVLETPPVRLTLDPDKPDYDLEEVFTARVRVRHQLPDPATYTFQEMIVIESREEPLLEIRKSEIQPFELSADDRERTFEVRVESVGRGITKLETRVERTDASGVKEIFTDEVELLVAPLESEVTITSGEHLLNQTPEEEWSARARAINAKRRNEKLTPYSNLIEIQLKLTNKSGSTVENINIPEAINILSLISSMDIKSPGVPLKPVQFYAPDGTTIDLTNPAADPSIEEVTLAPDEFAVYAWVLDAFDANPAPEEDDSADLEFKALVLGGIGNISVRELATAEFKVIDQPLLEWGIRPKDGRTAYQSGQVVRVDGYIENISTRDSKPPQDIRVMVYQVPEGNLGGGFMFDNAEAGGPTPKYYKIFELPAEGPGKVKDLSAVFRSFPTVMPSSGKVRFGVRLWTVKPDPEAPGGEVVEEASGQAILLDEWTDRFEVSFSPNRPAFTSKDECYALGDTIPELTGIWPFLCGLREGLTVDLTDGIIGLGKFLYNSGELTLDAGAGIATWEFHMMSKVWDAIQGDTAAQNALFQEAYVQYRTYVELGVMAGDAGSKLPMVFEKFAIQSVGAMAEFFNAVEKGEIRDIEFAVGKFLGANPDMILEPLVVARNYQRMTKAMLALEEELVDSSIRASVKAEKARQAASIDKRLSDAVAAGRAPETALLPGDILSDSKLLDIYGVTIDQRKAIQKIARDNGVVITFRSRNPLSVKILKEGRGYPKPQALKHKTVNQIDIDFLGYRNEAKATLEMVEPPAGLLDANGRALSGDALDSAIDGELQRLSGKIGNNNVLREEVRGRMKTRAEEWNKLFFDKLDTTTPGTIEQKITTAFEAELQSVGKQQDLVRQVGAIEDRIVTYQPIPGRKPRTWEMKMTGPKNSVGIPGPPKAVTGDVDFLAVLDEFGGLIRDPNKRAEIYAQLETALDMQHGESYTFFIQKARLEHLRCCALGEEGAEAMVAISGLGDSTPRAAYFVDNLSIIDQGKNGKYLPKRAKLPQSFREFILKPGQAKEVRRADPSGEFMLLDGVHITTKPPLDLVNRFVPYTLSERLESFLTSPNFILPAVMLRLFDRNGETVFSKDESAAVIQAIENGDTLVLRQWIEGQGWNEISVDQALAAGNPDNLELKPMTLIPEGASAGTSRIEIASQEMLQTTGAFFDVGDRVVINPGGPNEEVRTVRALGSLIFSRGLDFDHTSGEMVVSLGSDRTDRDGDGLPGFLEVLVGTDPDNADTDGDGLSDKVELDSGTDPLDGGASGLEVTLVAFANDGETLFLEWMGQVGGSYSVEYSAAIESGQWLPIRQVDAISQPRQSITLTGLPSDQPQGFIRIRLIGTP